MNYKINIKKQLHAMQDSIFFSLFCIIAVLLIGYSNGFEIDLFVFFGAFYFLNILLVLFLHIQFYSINKNCMITFDKTLKEIIYKSKESLLKVNFDDIKNIEIHMTPSLYRKSSFQIFPFEQYHYAVIITETKRIIITNLMIINASDVFSDLDLKVKRVKRIFPMIR